MSTGVASRALSAKQKTPGFNVFSSAKALRVRTLQRNTLWYRPTWYGGRDGLLVCFTVLCCVSTGAASVVERDAENGGLHPLVFVPKLSLARYVAVVPNHDVSGTWV